LRGGGWRDGKGLPQVLKGQRLGLVGFGAIGQMVGKVGQAFGKMFRKVRQLFDDPELGFLTRGRKTARREPTLRSAS